MQHLPPGPIAEPKTIMRLTETWFPLSKSSWAWGEPLVRVRP